MTDEIFNVMKHFYGSYINQCGELIISERGNVYFTATNCKDKEDIISYSNGVQDRLQKECHTAQIKEIMSGENLYYVATTIISAQISRRMICIGYMTN